MADEVALLVLRCHCGQQMKVPAAALQKSCRCVKCGERIQVSTENTIALKQKPTEAAAPPDASPVAAGQDDLPHLDRRIGEMLIEERLISPEQLEEALAK